MHQGPLGETLMELVKQGACVCLPLIVRWNMSDSIRFETKEESNARRERAFLVLTPHERFLWFLRSFDERVSDPDTPERPTTNFVIRKKHDPIRKGDQ